MAFYSFTIFGSKMQQRRARAELRSRLSSRLGNKEPEELKDVVDALARSDAFGIVAASKIWSFLRPYLNIATLRTLRQFAFEATKPTSSMLSKTAR